mmetsp:Transcript_37017/g.98025  ORF Transcript_37017/g.98025 Transcript_37017/m.98025 type:complete len:189 (-) Transcript_37017:44-610(-)
MRRCPDCPKYPIPIEEQGEDDDEETPKIKFHVYKTVKETIRNKERTRKYLTLLERPIGIFHKDYYLPALEKLVYHNAYRRILGKDHCGAQRKAAFKQRPGDAKTRRDYAERLAALFDLEVQSEHFQNRTLSMEGCAVETFCTAAVDAYTAGVWEMDEAELKMVFFSHLSDDSRQDAALRARGQLRRRD